MTSEVINKTYSSVYEEIEALEVPKKKWITALVLSTIVPILIVAGPILLCVNCLIFNNFMVLFVFLIHVLVILAAWMGNYMYYHTITEGKVSGLYHIWVIHTAIVAAVVLFIFMIITMIGVI